MFNNNHLYVAFRPFKFCKGYNEDWIRETNKTQCVYFLVNDVPGISRKAEDVTAVNALFIDMDGGSEWNGHDGTVVVGRDATHWHAYWPLVPGESLEKWKVVQKALIKHFKSDPACSDISRVMRVWGSVNRKPSAMGATYSIWKKEDKKWTIDEVVGFYGLDIKDGASLDYERMEITLDGVTCPVHVRDELKAEIENLCVEEGHRYAAARNWSAQALGAGMPADEVHRMACEALIRWGYDADRAQVQASNAQVGTIEKLKAGKLKINERFRPDLDFKDEEAEAMPEGVVVLGPTLLEQLEGADDPFTWLKDHIEEIARLPAFERERLRDSWPKSKRAFDACLASVQGKSEAEEIIDWGAFATEYLEGRKNPLVFVEDEWYEWRKVLYEKIEEIWVKKDISDRIPEPTVSKVHNAFQQVQFAALKNMDEEPAGIPFRNGRLMPDGELVPLSPVNGGRYCLDFAYDKDATCPTWERCLVEWFGGDSRALLLRQWTNYLVTRRDELHKIMLLMGQQRGGKGTIVKLLQALIGKGNYSSPSMYMMASEFGLQASLGKQVMFISDAHLPYRDRSTILDRLKGISGKDRMDVNRKNLTVATNAKLGQIIIACNTMADIQDESNALIDRYSILTFSKSYLGKEDSILDQKLIEELPGIFNWAMACPAYTRFVEEERGAETKKLMSQSANPYRAWAMDCLEWKENEGTDTEHLLQNFKIWVENTLVKMPFHKSAMVMKLREIYPDSKIVEVRQGGTKSKKIMGVVIKSRDYEEDEESF